jgi:hypothetical protein
MQLASNALQAALDKHPDAAVFHAFFPHCLFSSFARRLAMQQVGLGWRAMHYRLHETGWRGCCRARRLGS